MVLDPEWERIFDTVRLRLPGVQDSVLKHELYLVVDEFFEETNAWYEEVVFDTVPDQLEYDIEPEATARITRLLDIRTTGGSRVRAIMEEPGVITLLTATNTIEEYAVTFALRPRTTTSDDVPSIPLWLLRKYRDAFEHGLLARMMMQPAKPYSNERQALLYEREFLTAKSTARVEARRKNLHGVQVWSFPRF